MYVKYLFECTSSRWLQPWRIPVLHLDDDDNKVTYAHKHGFKQAKLVVVTDFHNSKTNMGNRKTLHLRAFFGQCHKRFRDRRSKKSSSSALPVFFPLFSEIDFRCWFSRIVDPLSMPKDDHLTCLNFNCCCLSIFSVKLSLLSSEEQQQK